jgi:hypothetical protein
MNEGYFTDYSKQPSQEEVHLALGSVYPLWKSLTNFIRNTYQITGIWSSWGPAKSGWGLRYRRKGKSLIALYPQEERFIAQVVLGKKEVEKALNLNLGQQVSKILAETPELRDGRWLSIPVSHQADVTDIEQLLLVKMRPKKNVKEIEEKDK